MQMSACGILFYEQVAAFASFEETQIKCQLGTGAGGLELVKYFLVINGLRPFRKRTLLINIFDTAQETVSGHLALVESAQWFDLARQPVGGRQNRSLAEEILTRPGQGIAK